MSLTSKLANKLTNYGSPDSVGSRLRAKRIGPLLAMIEASFRQSGPVRIIDIGGRETYWGIVPDDVLEKNDVHITIVNLPGSEATPDRGRFSFVAADGCDLSAFDDNAFDIAHSNSVVEHVGDWPRMVRFAREVSRVAPRYFVQTPNFWFPIEPHCMTPFFHWLPKPTRIWLVSRFRLGHWSKATTVDEAHRTVESARLLNRASFKALFADAQVSTERVLLLPKSFVAVRP